MPRRMYVKMPKSINSPSRGAGPSVGLPRPKSGVKLSDVEKKDRRIAWYQRRFELWIPLDANIVDDDDDDSDNTDTESSWGERSSERGGALTNLATPPTPTRGASSSSSPPDGGGDEQGAKKGVAAGSAQRSSRPPQLNGGLPLASLMVPVEEVLDHLVLKSIRKTSIRRFALFALFMFTYFIVLTMQRSLSDSFALESAIKNRVVSIESPTGVTFDKITNVVQLWDWLESSFFDLIFPEERWYNGDLINATNPNEAGYVFMYNKPIAGFELVQHRVSPGVGCDLSPDFCNVYPTVWVDLDSSTTTSDPSSTDDKPFGPAYDPHKYKWRPDNAGEYGGGGYMVDFPLDAEVAAYKVQELKHDRWIDKQTRKLQAVFTVYNGNLRLFAVSRLIVDFDSAGNVGTSISIGSLRLDDTVLLTDWVRVGLEGLVVLFALHHTWIELLELLEYRRGYFIFW